MKSIWSQIARYSPILCRLLARVPRGRPLTTGEIAQSSGLTPAQVEALSQSTTWAGIDVLHMRAFMQACGVDIGNVQQIDRVEDYIRKGARFSYLKRSPEWETYYKPMMGKWIEFRKGTR